MKCRDQANPFCGDLISAFVFDGAHENQEHQRAAQWAAPEGAVGIRSRPCGGFLMHRENKGDGKLEKWVM